MKNRKSDFQSQQPPHTAPFSPSPPPPHSGRWEADSASTQLLPPPGSLPPCPGDSQGKPPGASGGEVTPAATRDQAGLQKPRMLVLARHAKWCYQHQQTASVLCCRRAALTPCCPLSCTLSLCCPLSCTLSCLSPFQSLLFSVTAFFSTFTLSFFFFPLVHFLLRRPLKCPFPCWWGSACPGDEGGSGSRIPPFFAPTLNLSAISCHGQPGRCKAWGEQPSCHLPKLEVFPGEAAAVVIFMTEGWALPVQLTLDHWGGFLCVFCKGPQAPPEDTKSWRNTSSFGNLCQCF